MIYISFLAIAVISYLLGSLNFGVILSKSLAKDDVRNHGSGNAGSTNMLRNFGKKAAVFTVIGDMIKVFAAVFIASKIIQYTAVPLQTSGLPSFVDYNLFLKSFAGFFCVIGHIFPVYFKFKGGKGVAASGGMVFAIDWRIALILFAVFIIVLLLTKYVSLGSISMAILYPFMMFVFHKSIALTIIAAVFMIIVLTTHIPNIARLINHTENKVEIFKSKE